MLHCAPLTVSSATVANLGTAPLFKTTYFGATGGNQSVIVHMTDPQTRANVQALCKNVRASLSAARAIAN